MFVWTDIETTGLNPAGDQILSVGMIITDDAFREIARKEWDVYGGQHLNMSAYVRDMHTKSRLLDRCQRAPLPFVVKGRILAWLDEHLGAPSQDVKLRPVMAGNSVHFDRAFLRVHMPEVLDRVHYRLLDVSTLKVLCTATVPGAAEWEAARGEAAHTCLADLDASLGELAHWRWVLAGAPGSVGASCL